LISGFSQSSTGTQPLDHFGKWPQLATVNLLSAHCQNFQEDYSFLGQAFRLRELEQIV
jgi:hypothetical protein